MSGRTRWSRCQRSKGRVARGRRGSWAAPSRTQRATRPRAPAARREGLGARGRRRRTSQPLAAAGVAPARTAHVQRSTCCGQSTIALAQRTRGRPSWPCQHQGRAEPPSAWYRPASWVGWVARKAQCRQGTDGRLPLRHRPRGTTRCSDAPSPQARPPRGSGRAVQRAR